MIHRVPIPGQRAVSVGQGIGCNCIKGDGMACHRVRFALLLGALTAVVTPLARADSAAPAPAAPAMRTIQVVECVEEKFQVKRTCYRLENRTETVDGFRCECVPEVQERVCTVVKKIPCVTTVVKKICVKVPCCEERIVMKPCYKTVTETCMVKKCVSKGHHECRSECVPLNFLDKLCGRKADCCLDPCDCCPTGKCRTRKVWVDCPQYIDCPVTKCRKVCEMVPTKCVVRTCRTEVREEPCQVCTYKCVEEKIVQKCTVYVSRKVACKITRCCQVCVPYEETVTCCRLVPRVVNKQVADCCPPCCCTPCCRTSCKPCCTPCCQPCCEPRCPRSCSGLCFRQSCCH